jgi:signal transduction histidine kinase
MCKKFEFPNQTGNLRHFDAMKKDCHGPIPRKVAFATLLAAVLGSSGVTASGMNPIGRVARMFNPELVRIEERVVWLDGRLSTLAHQREFTMNHALGVRGGRLDPDDPAPTLTLDFGAEIPLDALYMIPAQREIGQSDGLFPRRFTIETSNDPGFVESTVVYSSGQHVFGAPRGTPVRFLLPGTPARFLRVTIDEGHQRGGTDVFTLAELLVFSGDEPVSFGAGVRAEGTMDVQDTWHPSFLTDGRMPLGIWQAGAWTRERGDLVVAADAADAASWTLALDGPAAVDRIVLFPYQLAELMDTGIFPDELTVHLLTGDGGEELVHTWQSKQPGSSHMTPMVIPLGGREASGVRITGIRPWQIANRHVHGLSEIEVWSGGRNIALGREVVRHHRGSGEPLTVLTDGFASERQILRLSVWLNQIHERSGWEREFSILQPIRQQMAAETELNATWGSAVMLGLTFLIPVVIVERRRLISRNQLDKLRKRIASDLHDDIGSNLGSISLIARTARKDLVRLHGPKEVAEDLDEVESIARESSLAMRDIVWLLERRQDSIGDLIHRMRETASRMLREIDYAIDCDSSKVASKLSLDAKRHLFLFYKEGIHNILKHAKATRVTVRVSDDGDKLVLEIRDNGIGLDEDTAQQSSSKLRERARVLEGSLQIDSTPGKGTSLRLSVRRSHLVVRPSIS